MELAEPLPIWFQLVKIWATNLSNNPLGYARERRTSSRRFTLGDYS
jgi:hypothetical protein